MGLMEPIILAAQHSPTITRKVPEFAYLNTENTKRYRPIMRFFYLKHSANEYWLSVDDVIQHMRKHHDPAYTDAMAEDDLNFLYEHDNLLREQDTAKARTVEEFLKKHFLYQITPYTVEIERTVIDFERGEGGKGSLDTTRLETLWSALAQLRDRLKEPPSAPDREWLHQTHGLWQTAYETFVTLRDDATDYFAALNRFRPDDFQDVERFVTYKSLLTDYLEKFINDLMNYKDKIRSLLLHWQGRRVGEALIQCLTHYHAQYVPSTDGVLPDRTKLAERFDRQYGDVLDWFQVRAQRDSLSGQRRIGSLDMLRRATMNAIERITMHATRLSDRRQIGMSRQKDLEKLARAFAACKTSEQAHRLFSLAFGISSPQHILGTHDQIVMAQNGSVWHQPPHAFPLAPVTRGRPERMGGSAIRNRQKEKQALLAATQEKRERELAFWDGLFGAGEINLGELILADGTQRDRVLELLGRCLTASDASAIASDGTRVDLKRPGPDEPYGELKAPDGILLMPQYRLRRRREGTTA